MGALDMRHEPGGADQRLGRHATRVQAIAPHLVLLDQRHLRLDGSRDVSRHQAGGTGAYNDQVAVEPGRPHPVGVYLARLDRVDDFLRHQRKNAQQHERADQPGREDGAGRGYPGDLRTGVDVDDRAGQHAQLAHPIVSPDLHRGESQCQIDQEKRERGHQAQGEQVEAALLVHAGIDGAQLVAELQPDPVAKQEARCKKRQRRAEAGCERDDQSAPGEAEDRAGRKGHDAGDRKR